MITFLSKTLQYSYQSLYELKLFKVYLYPKMSLIYRVAPKHGTVDFFLGLCSDQQLFFFTLLVRASLPHYNKAKKKNCYVALTRPKFKNWVGRSGFFFFFLRTVRELSFPIFFLQFLNGENSGGMQSKRIYKSCKCFFKPLNTNFCKFFAQI